MYRKTYKCQDSVYKYGLKDIILEFDKDVDFPYYGLTFAQKKDFGNGVYEYISYLKEDETCADFRNTLAHKLLVDPKVKVAMKSEEPDKSKKEIIIKYNLLYYNPNSGIFKPTILSPVTPDREKETKIVYEFLFAFPDGWIFPLEHVAMTGGREYFPTVDFWKDELKDLNEDGFSLFANCDACKFDLKAQQLSLEVSNLKGEYTTLNYNQYTKQEITDSLVSVRIVEMYQRKAYSDEEWEKIETTYPFLPQYN